MNTCRDRKREFLSMYCHLRSKGDVRMKQLQKVNSPADIKKMSVSELKELAQDMRDAIIKGVHTHGGHYGPDLGIVETTIALHYVFNSPSDKFIFDVSHQCYPHKMITGRKDKFLTEEGSKKYTGYTNPDESEHDFFTVGHTSTSISLATGLAKARDLQGQKGNVIAIIGDGSMSGGEAFEGLNNAAELGTNFIVIFNDNDQSIAENHGGMYRKFKELRETNGQAEDNFFRAMGLDYRFVADGNDVEAMIKALEDIKDIDHPIVLHVVTQKGKGDKAAEINKEAYHWILPDSVDTSTWGESYEQMAANCMLEEMKHDPSLIAICPAVPGGLGWTKENRDKAGKQYWDPGIAEEQAVAMAAGLAKGGAKPVIFDIGTFLQRTYDQLIQDLCINSNPATIISASLNGGISDADVTHSGAFDMAMMGSIPNLLVLSPASKDEFMDMFKWSIKQTKQPVVIRTGPVVREINTGATFDGDLSYQIIEKGNQVAVLGLGNFYDLAVQVKDELAKKLGIKATLINPRFSSGIDEKILQALAKNHQLVVTLEDGILDGGFGEKVARFYGPSAMKTLAIGQRRENTDRVPYEELVQRYHLSPELIVKDIKNILE